MTDPLDDLKDILNRYTLKRNPNERTRDSSGERLPFLDTNTPTPSGMYPSSGSEYILPVQNDHIQAQYGSYYGPASFADDQSQPYQYSQGTFSPPAHHLTAASLPPPLGLIDQIEERCQVVAGQVKANLKQKSRQMWLLGDDALFDPHTIFVQESLKIRMPMHAITIWENSIQEAVQACEDVLKQMDPNARIHKGAIYYNLGLCFIKAGNLDRAMEYIAEGGKENELSGTGSEGAIITGQGLSKEVLVDPILTHILPNWAADYEATNAVHLDEPEFESLIGWLSLRLSDALQTLVSLHRVLGINGTTSFRNNAVQHNRILALGDLLAVIESSIRRWQKSADGQLMRRCERMISNALDAKHSFESAHKDFCDVVPQEFRESGHAVNYIVDRCLSLFDGSSSVQSKAGITLYLAVRLRNSLLHVNEEDLDLRTNEVKFQRVVALMFSALRLSKHAESRTLASL